MAKAKASKKKTAKNSLALRSSLPPEDFVKRKGSDLWGPKKGRLWIAHDSERQAPYDVFLERPEFKDGKWYGETLLNDCCDDLLFMIGLGEAGKIGVNLWAMEVVVLEDEDPDLMAAAWYDDDDDYVVLVPLRGIDEEEKIPTRSVALKSWNTISPVPLLARNKRGRIFCSLNMGTLMVAKTDWQIEVS